MKFEFPLETWTDIFRFLPRSQLVQLAPYIHDRKLASPVQFFLHKCSPEFLLGDLHIKLSKMKRGTAFVQTSRGEWPLTDMPISQNIIDFREIYLSHIDQPVKRFLQAFRHNSLLTNINLTFHQCDTDDMFTFIGNVLPMFATSIISIKIDYRNILVLLQDEYFEMAKLMFESARILISCYNHRYDWFCQWLNTPTADGTPRNLVLKDYAANRDRSISSFVEHIKKDFMISTKAVSFFIHLDYFFDVGSIKQISLANIQTRERFVIEHRHWSIRTDWFIRISRCPMEATKEWMDEMRDYSRSEYRNIIIDI